MAGLWFRFQLDACHGNGLAAIIRKLTLFRGAVGMIVRKNLLLTLALLAGCTPALEPSDTSAVVELNSGGAFSGYQQFEVFPDDIMRTTVAGPFDEKKRSASRQLNPGAFVAARDHILANPIPQKVLDAAGDCDDYGGDIVSYSGPDKQVKYLAHCPSERLHALFGEVSDIIDSHDPKAQPVVSGE
ncbi:hypothetical protein FQV27_08625 [Paracoccus aurantiacus]|uniref:Uncharacterized protein n=1 Tax=Paracoccus aurantiacus TaxID=2599412 RepID=A0A5C6S3N3_9RHOB|nr:hypothetical protein [Paracoccus aurantiacus]TXB69035.1 hypothetical protein FQV27_08625 [Paracoccus aurantiacus]